MRRLLPLVFAAACSKSSGAGGPPPDPACLPDADGTVADAPLYTPRWAFEPWLSKDYSSSDDTRAFVQGSIDRGIPVGVAVLDSPWETDYNTFVPDESPGRYHDFDALVRDLNGEGVKLVVWITGMVNASSFDLESGATTHYEPPAPGHDLALGCGFFVDEGTDYPWYKGRGGAVDFMNPHALAWWHGLQDAVLGRGISGYKVDFSDGYVTSDPVVTAKGPVSHQEYSEAYYRDLRAYATSKRGRDFVTMARGWDESYTFAPRTYARPEDAPVVWAGDNRRDWVGIADVLHTSFMNATLGYVVMGSDVGGYLDRDDKNVLSTVPIPLDTLVFARWSAMGALMPLMQLHTRADLMPWTVPDHVDETIALYRYWATLHHELVPFFYALAQETYAKRARGILRPVGDAGDYRYLLGDAFLVAPILDASGVRDVPLPSDAAYYDWFDPAADAHPAGTTVHAYDASDRAKYPLFVRQGAIVPLSVDSDAVPVGTAAAKGAWTVLVYPSPAATSFTLYEDDDSTTQIDASAAGMKIARALKPILLRVRADAPASGAVVNGAPAAAAADYASLAAATVPSFWSDRAARASWVKIPAGAGPFEVHFM